MTVTYQLVKRSDLQYVQALQSLASQPFGRRFRQIGVRDFIGRTRSCTVESVLEDPTLDVVLSAGGQVFQLVTLSDEHTSIQISRAAIDDLFDTVTVNPGKKQGSTDNRISEEDFGLLLTHLQKELPPTSAENLGALLGEGVEKHFAAREVALNRFESLNHDILHEQNRIRREMENELSEKRTKLEAEFTEKSERLDNDHETASVALEKREKELAERKKELDDRSSTHARRAIREDLKTLLRKNERLKTSSDTRWRRGGIMLVYTLLIAAFAWQAYPFLAVPVTATNTAANSSESIEKTWELVRQCAAAVGAVVTAGFFLRWLNSWNSQMAGEELKQKQFELDIDRASWLVEMALEWDKEKQTEIPEQLLKQLSQNLFETSSHHDEAGMTAADTLASAMLKGAVRAKVPLGSGELEFDRKGLRSMDKDSKS